MVMNEHLPNESQNKETLIVDSLPLPPRVIDVIERMPEECPLTEEDFARLEGFFDSQVDYYQSLADSADSDEHREIYTNWANRVPEIFQIVRENTRMIPEILFTMSVKALAQKIEQNYPDGEYLVFLHGDNLDDAKNHSTFFLAQQMKISPEKFITKAEMNDPAIQDKIQAGIPILIIDDAAYSGQNVIEHKFDIERSLPELNSEQLHTYFVGLTKDAEKRMREDGIANINAILAIPELKDIEEFDADDFRIIRFMQRLDDHGDSTQLMARWDHVLTFLWQKVPDNFCHPLRKWYNKYWDGENHHFWDGYLVDDSPTGIHPNYRGGKTYTYS